MRIYSREFLQAVESGRSAGLDREHLMLGRYSATSAPAFVSRKSRGEGALLVGSAGSGKSAALARMIEYEAALGNLSVVVFDLKSHDSSLLQAMIQGAKIAQRSPKVQWFVNQVGLSTHTFNLFEQRAFRAGTPFQKASAIGMALGTTQRLDGPPHQFFGGASLRIYQQPFDFRHEIQNWRELAETINRIILASKRQTNIPAVIREHGSQAWLDSDRMASVEALNVVGNPEGIDCAALFESPHLVYFCLPEHETGGAVCRAMLRSIFDGYRFSSKRCGVMVVIDEFQVAISDSLSNVMLQARSALNGGGFIGATQTLKALKLGVNDLAPIALNSCRLFWAFNFADLEEQTLFAKISGTKDTVEITETWSPFPGFWAKTGHTEKKVTVELYPQAEVKRVSAEPTLSFLTLSQNEGRWQHKGVPQVIEAMFHITRDEYLRRSQAPWPDPAPGCIITRMPAPFGEVVPIAKDEDEEEAPPPMQHIGRPRKK